MSMTEDPEFLEHYASPYYDPVKAHEYYEAHKQLKGRRSTSKLNEQGKEIWSYTKESIKNEKTAKVEQEKEKRQRTIEKHREDAARMRERITQKLKALSEKLASARKNDQITTEQKTNTLARARASSKAERERVANHLKSAVSAAREAYKQTKLGLDASYEEIYQREFDKIAAEYGAVKKKRSSK